MILAVISGKGGTGKTTVATSLARVWNHADERNVWLADADVEGPNARHFLPGLTWEGEREVHVPVPVVDPMRCTQCGVCAAECAFNALAVLPSRVLVSHALCHGCGLCTRVCPSGAIDEEPRPVGGLRSGHAGTLPFLEGAVSVGEARAVPVIHALLEEARARCGEADLILDGPPGAACPTAEVVAAADVCLLVTEPTPFGLHDLIQAHALLSARKKPAGVLINRVRGARERHELARWCREQRLPVLLEIDDRRDVAEAYARGSNLLDALPELAEDFLELRSRLSSLARGENEGAVA